MPRIFDNIEQQLLSALEHSLEKAYRADFCVGYFNLRGWEKLAPTFDASTNDSSKKCRLLIGMQSSPAESLKKLHGLAQNADETIDQSQINPLKKQFAEEFRQQLSIGTPSNKDEQTLRHLVEQLETQRLTVKLFLRHPLHAKLYLLFRQDRDNPITGYLGSSNLTFAGLLKQGELNIDVLDHDACEKLAEWFENRWQDRFCIDISKDLSEIIRESWLEPIPPYHIFLKIAYYLSQEARAGLNQYEVPRIFGQQLFKYQIEAVKIITHRLEKRGGAIIGDVVGLGKTLMASAIIRLFEEQGWSSLIICPKQLETLWKDYCKRYELKAHILPLSQVNQLAEARRFRLVVIDESHHLRNREGQRYQQVRDYLYRNDSKVLLLSATPYNKDYLDLANQLRLFIEADENIGIRPEQLLIQNCHNDVKEFEKQFQCDLHSLAAFEESDHADDWRELMRLYMLRRTRSFVQQYYAETDTQNGKKFLTFADGQRAYFPTRHPKTLRFGGEITDPYAKLYAEEVVNLINQLHLPRYGLGSYILSPLPISVTPEERKILNNLSKAGKRLMGFCRTNLFKRLESSGYAFHLSLERHILRNQVFLYAIENQLPLPIGAQDAVLLDSIDSDIEWAENEETEEPEDDLTSTLATSAQIVYETYQNMAKKRFKWLSSHLVDKNLANHLNEDNYSLQTLLRKIGQWLPEQDSKLQKLRELLTIQHPQEKVLIFTQFSDTANYLYQHLNPQIPQLSVVTGATANPTELIQRFSPVSNYKTVEDSESIRVLITTDVLSEGQNLQDCAIMVNYDLTWAIIRLIQRAGRIDRIGQQAPDILCYSFLPVEGVEKIIGLRAKLTERLHQHQQVLGTDEQFFEDEGDKLEAPSTTQQLRDLYSEKSGILDEAEGEVDLASYAYSIWQDAIEKHPELENKIKKLVASVHSSRAALAGQHCGVLVYVRTSQGNDALAYLDEQGQVLTESQFEILEIARCDLDTPALPKSEFHHDLVKQGVDFILTSEEKVGGQLGKPTSVRRRVYERLTAYHQKMKDTLFPPVELESAINLIYQYPLQESAKERLRRQLAQKITDESLSNLVIALYEEKHLCVNAEITTAQEPLIVCSLGMR